MKELLPDLDRWGRRGDRIAVATVVSVTHSAPRPLGAKLLVSERGQVAGSVSGGCVEGAVVEVAERILAGAPPQLLRFGITDDAAWDVGLPCGGDIEVFVEVGVPDVMARAARAGERAVVVTAVAGPGLGKKRILAADGGVSGSLDAPEILERARQLMRAEVCEREGDLFFDVVAPEPRLIIVGAGDISVALCRLASLSGWRTFVIDPRARFATRERFPTATEILCEWPDRALARLTPIDPADSVLALTHDPKLDDAALAIALRSPARFIGAMGSRRAHARRCERLSAAGLPASALSRIAAPLGLDLGAANRAETALSMFAEVVAARHGRSGGRLLATEGRIHDSGVVALAHYK